MSQWTHVAGIIRVDSLLDMVGRSAPPGVLIRAVSLPPPTGSEGPIQFDVVGTRQDNSLAWGHISFWGDLRDYDKVEELRAWFEAYLKALMRQRLAIRQAIMEAQVEGYSPLTFVYRDPDVVERVGPLLDVPISMSEVMRAGPPPPGGAD